MNEITICDTALGIKEYNGQRVVTFKDIDTVHQRPDGTSSRNFRKHRDKFIETTDYYILNQPDEIRRLGFTRPQGGVAEQIILITESGYLMLAKSLTDDLAWQVQRELVKSYFRVQSISTDYTALATQITTLKAQLEATQKLALFAARSIPQPPDYRIQYNSIAPIITKLQHLLGKSSHKEVLSYIYDTMEEHGGFNRKFAMNRLKSRYPTYYVDDKQPSIIDSIVEFPDYYEQFMKTLARVEKRLTTVTSDPVPTLSPEDKIQNIIAPLIAKRNDHSMNGIKTYGLVYKTMGSKASWSQLMRRCGVKTKKEVLLARPDKYDLFCRCVQQLMAD